MCMYGIIMSALIHTMIGKHHLKLDMLGEFFEQSVTKMLDHYNLKEQLAAVNEELKPMKDIRYWVSKVLSPEQTGEKQPEPKHSLKERLQYEQEQKKQKQVQKAPKQKKQDMEL